MENCGDMYTQCQKVLDDWSCSSKSSGRISNIYGRFGRIHLKQVVLASLNVNKCVKSELRSRAKNQRTCVKSRQKKPCNPFTCLAVVFSMPGLLGLPGMTANWYIWRFKWEWQCCPKFWLFMFWSLLLLQSGK